MVDVEKCPASNGIGHPSQGRSPTDMRLLGVSITTIHNTLPFNNDPDLNHSSPW